MAHIPIEYESDQNMEIYYTDRGQGEPIILIHGYPFSGVAWERQEKAFIEAGYRVIAYDRRGFGQSGKPATGYDYNTFASDLNMLIETLKLDNVSLIGHSMGTGEIARYISRFGPKKILHAVMISPILPFLLKTPDNPRGVEKKVFDEIKAAIEKDRYGFIPEFLKNFYASSMTTDRVSKEKLQADFNLAAQSGAIAFSACVESWLEDFRDDVAKIDVPLLIIHGDADKILPIESTAQVLKEIVGRLVVIKGGPHGIPWTHSQEVNQAILTFLDGNRSRMRQRPVQDVQGESSMQ